MAKWVGNIGFSELKEVDPGVWEKVITPVKFLGEMIINKREFQNNSQINDEIKLSNQVRIISYPYARLNCDNIVWVEYLGKKWKVVSISIEQPALILTLGGIYNESFKDKSSQHSSKNNG